MIFKNAQTVSSLAKQSAGSGIIIFDSKSCFFRKALANKRAILRYKLLAITIKSMKGFQMNRFLLQSVEFEIFNCKRRDARCYFSPSSKCMFASLFLSKKNSLSSRMLLSGCCCLLCCCVRVCDVPGWTAGNTPPLSLYLYIYISRKS